MLKKVILWGLSLPVLGLQGIFLFSLMEDTKVNVELPQPDYHPQQTDPAWLAQAVQFHGHLGPWATAGLRFGVAGRQAVGAKGYFDLEVRCQGPLAHPPQSCFLDGLQVGTGATWGKRNIHWEPGEELVVRVKNTRTGQTAEVRPTPYLVEMLASLKTKPKAQGSDDHDHDHLHEHHSSKPLSSGRPAAKESSALPHEVASCPEGVGQGGTCPSGKPGVSAPEARGDSSREKSASSAESQPAPQPEPPEHPVEAMARKIARLPDGKLLTVTILSVP